MGCGVRWRVASSWSAAVKERAISITKLRLTGIGQQPAEVSFSNGLNVISGPSNTGKSYVLACIDYMLGARDTPDPIPESRGYVTAWLELSVPSGKRYALERSLKGGAFRLYERPLDQIESHTPSRTLAQQHRNKESISSFLLELAGFRPARIRKNAKLETSNLTFRMLSHLILISETRILEKSSPIRTATGVVANTQNKWTFNFLITGVDDSSVISLAESDNQRASQTAGRQVLGELLEELHARIGQLPAPDEARSRIDAIDKEMMAATVRMSEGTRRINELQKVKRDLWKEKTTADSRLIVLAELDQRFHLLKQHYTIDLQRLEMTSDGAHLLDQLETVTCPYCGSPLDSHIQEHRSDVDTATLASAIEEESRKIRYHLTDLASTQEQNSVERSEIEARVKSLSSDIGKIDSQINQLLNDSINDGRIRFDQLSIDRTVWMEAEFYQNTIRSLSERQSTRGQEFEDGEGEGDRESSRSHLDTMALRELMDEIGALLTVWDASKDVVEFSEPNMDLLVGGKPRQSNGKGVRALLHAAFTLGLMSHCQNRHLPHPGFVILDSPLTTLKEHHTEADDEEVAGHVQHQFFEHLAVHYNAGQVIILENKTPPAIVDEHANHIIFTGTANGRRGFFPNA